MLRIGILSFCLIAWAGLSFGQQPVIYLVRHAEKVDDSRDPELSEAGRARARRLAELLADAEIDRVFSTDFIRTRDTARPTAERLGVEIELYGDLDALARELASQTKRVLVIGHSNTTTALVELLGGEPGGPIDEAEYDRFYIVVPSKSSERAETILLRLPAAEP